MIVMLPLSSLQPAFTAIVHAEGTDDYVAESVISEDDTDEDAIYSVTPENPSEDVISNEDTVENGETVTDEHDVIVGEETENNDEEDADVQNADEEADAEDGKDASEEDANLNDLETSENTDEEIIIIQEEVNETVSLEPKNGVIIELGLQAVLNECADSVLTWNKAELENAEYFVYRNDELIDSFSLDDGEGEENAKWSEEEGLISYVDSNTTADTEFSYKVVLKVGETIYSESETVSVKTPEALIIENEGYYSLSSDLTVFEVKQTYGTRLYLNGYTLTICKNYTVQSYNSYLSLNKGSLICHGNIERQGSWGEINVLMEYPQDYIFVEGNANIDFDSKTVLNNGVLEVCGDVEFYGFNNSDYFKLKLSGDERQNISINYEDAYIEYLIVNNTSEEGINFVKPAIINGYEFNDDVNVFVRDEKVENGFTLFEDTTIEGNYSFGFGILDLNGHTLTINGNFNQRGGDLVVGDGELIVKGDYNIETEALNYYGSPYKTSSGGRLIMNNESGRVCVEGNFTTRSTARNEGLLTAGTLELKGDFNELYGSTANFRATEKHTVILSGEEKQTVEFSYSGSSNCYFNNLEIRNTSEEGVVFDTSSAYPLIIGKINDNDNLVTGAISINNTTSFENNHYRSDIYINESVTISNDFETDGNFKIGNNGSVSFRGNLTVGEDLSIQGIANVYSDINVKKNLYVGGEYDAYTNMYLYEGNISVEGNIELKNRGSYRSSYIRQNSSTATFTAKGDLILGDSCYLVGDSGTFTIYGDITGQGYVQLSKTHKTIFNGDCFQRVEVAENSYFATVEIYNKSAEGVSFRDFYAINLLTTNGNKLSYDDASGYLGWTLNEDTSIDGDMILIGDILNLNGYTLTIKGNLIQYSGTVDVNGGKLIIDGDYRIQKEQIVSGNTQYVNSNGKLKMVNPDDYVLIKGGFYTQSSESSDGLLTAGTLEVKGDFYQILGTNYNFKSKENHTVILSGEGKQMIKFASTLYFYSCFNNLEIKNESEEGVVFDSSYIGATGHIKDNGNKINGVIRINENTTFENNHYCSDILVDDCDFTLSDDFETEGDFKFDYTDIVTINGKLTVGGNLTLRGEEFNVLKDIFVGGNLTMNAEDIYIHSNVSVKGNAYIGDNFYYSTYAYLFDGSLTVDGNLEIKRNSRQTNTITEFSHSGGYEKDNPITVKGDVIVGERSILSGYGGPFTLGGNLTGSGSVRFGDEHRMVLNGNGPQRIEVEKNSYFGTLEIENTSEEGVSLLYLYKINNLVRNENIFNIDGISGKFGWTLKDDIVIEGDLNLIGDTLDLNGHKLEITGNLIQSSGKVFVNGGSLIVDGDYRIQKVETVEGNVQYSTGNGILKMTEKNDYVLVKGDFVVQSVSDSYSYLKEGVLELKGNLYQISNKDDERCSFTAEYNHTVLLSGDKKQIIKFDTSSNNSSHFNNIEIKNNSEEGVVLDTTSSYPTAIGNVKDNGNKVTGALGIGSYATFENNHYCSDLAVSDGYSIYSEVETDGNLIIDSSSYPDICGKFTIGGNLYCYAYDVDFWSDVYVKGNMYVNGRINDYGSSYGYVYLREGTLTVEGNLKIERQTEEGSLYIYHYNYYGDPDEELFVIKGDVNIGKDCYFSGSKGTLSIGGNVSSEGRFDFTKDHTTIFNGTDLQRINVSSDSRFAKLEINNHSEAGVEFSRMINYDSLERNGCIVSFGSNSFKTGWKLERNEDYDSDLYLCADTLDLNGYTLTVNGDFYAMAGTVKFNGGKLIVNGDYRVQIIESESDDNIVYGRGSGHIIMNNPDDYLLINGGFYYYSSSPYDVNANTITEGTIEIKGDFYQYGDSRFICEENNTIKFSGDEKQTFSTYYNSEFANLVNENTKELYLQNTIYLKGSLTDATQSFYITSPIDMSNPENIKDGIFSGSLYLEGDSVLQENLSIGGSLTCYGDVHANGKNISANSIQINKALYVDESSVSSANGIYVGWNAKLVMRNDKGYVLANDKFEFCSEYDHSDLLTAGTLELRGDFVQRYNTNFIATGTHTTILSPKKTTDGKDYIQTISFEYDAGTTRFNKVVLKKKESEYRFSPALSEISNEVVYDFDDAEAPTSVEFIVETEVTEQNVNISFGGAKDNNGIVGYEIYRDGKLIGVTSDTKFSDNSVDSNTQYTYAVFAFDEERNKASSSPALTVTTRADIEIPSTPQNLGLKTRTGSSVTIEWSPSTDNVKVVGYNIYADGELLEEKVFNTYYKAKNLDKTHIYKFTVKAVDKAGNLSESSSEIEAEVKMPSIISVTPDDYQRIGGNNTTLSVYFENVGNSTGNRVNIQMKNDEGKWVTLASKLTQKTASGNRLYASYVWDISEYEGEKSIDIRYVLTDADGNETTKEVTYVIDKEAPEAPTGLKAEPNNGNVNISFNPSASADCTKYEIHRVNYGGDDAIATLSGKNSVYYTDKDVAIGGTYEYYVYAFDSFYNKSSASERVTVTIEEDNVVPEIINVSPRAGRVNSDLKLEVLASDNKGVSVIGIQYKAEEATEWIDIEEKEASEEKAVFTFDTTTLADGDYFINAYAIDGSGNRSTELFTRRYSIDNTGVEKIVVSEVTSGVSFVRIEWEDVNDDNFGYFAVEQLIEGEFEQVAEESSTLGCHIKDLEPNTEYTFRVVGYDDLGNRGTESDEIVVSTTEDNVGPQITAVYPKASNYNGNLKLEMDANDENELNYAVFSYSYDGEKYFEIDKVKAKAGNKEEHFLKNFDLSEIKEGLIYVKFEVYDKAGNKNLLTKDDEDLIVEYNVDKTAPSKVKNLQSKSSAGSVELVWEKASEEETDVKGFKIWRADTSDGVYSVIKEETNTLNYFDYSVNVGSMYMYKVAAIDVAGNVGDESDEIIVTVSKDNEIPRVLGIYPKDNSTICANQIFSVTSMDNASVARVKLEYSNDEKNNFWKEIGTVSANENYCISDIVWDTEIIEEGEYSIRAIATDVYGNESYAVVNKYVLDKTAPVISSFETETGHFEININVNVIDENDFAKMDVLRREAGEEFKVIGKVESLSFTDDDVKPNKNYIYKVRVYDKAGNITASEESIGIADDIDVVAPTAVLPENYVGLVDMEIGLDGLASYDNVRITEYIWNMGDGNTVTGAIAKYKYKEAGTYEVKLTVKDAAKNETTVSTTAIIYDKEARDENGQLLYTRGKARVQVVDEDGKGIPYALVFLQNKENLNGVSLMTDGNGYIDIVQEAGGARVAAYKTNYLPAQKDILVSAYEVLAYKIVLREDELIVGNLSVHRMSLEEMVGVGVSFDNDANRHKYVFEINLVYEQKEYGLAWVINGDGSGAPCGSGHIETSGGGHIEIHAEIIEDQPILVFVNKRDEISWLKEMYQVDLTIVNMADFQFYIEGATASLSYPSGVSLADYTGPDLPKSFSNKVPIGSSGSSSSTATAVTSVSYPTYAHTSSASLGRIYGQEQKKVSWILRGDKSGEYSVSADFQGILMPFEARVSAHFETEAAFQVTTGEGIHITVMPEYTVDAGGELYVQYAVTNVSDHPIYGFETTIKPYEEPDQIYSVVDVNTGQVYEAIYRNGQCVYYHNDFEEGKEGNGKIHAKAKKTGQSLASNGPIKLDVIFPGESYYGTYVHQMPEAINAEDGKYYYFQFVEGFVNCLLGEDLGVTVSISPIPGHYHRDFYGKPEPMFPFLYDPVDVTSGNYQDDVEVMNIVGGQTVGYDLSYSSGNVEFDGENGFGWSNEYEIYIEQQNGGLKLHTSPSGTVTFLKKETDEHIIYVVENEEGEWELDSEADYSIGEYNCKTDGLGEFKIVRNQDLTYTLYYPGGLIKNFNADGKLTKIVSPEKQTISVSYEDNNTIIKEDISGKTITAVHDENGLVTEVYDSAGRVTYLAYNGKDLVAIVRPDGTQFKYSYDDNHRIIQASNANGVFVTNEYDDENRVVKQIDALNNEMSLSYEENEHGVTKVTAHNANGTEQIVYVDESVIVAEISEKGATTVYSYDVNGNLIEEIDPYENISYKEYDEKGNITKAIDKGKIETNFAYDSRGNVIGISGDGTTATYTYNEKNNMTSYKDPMGMVTTYEYNSDSQIISETKGELGSTQYGYTNGLITSITNPRGKTAYIEYDAYGNPIKQTDANGNVTTYTFDLGGNKLSETDALGNTTYYTYDCNGNCTSVKDALGNVTKYEYDAMSHRTKEIYPDGSVITYKYDSVGNCIEKTLPGGVVETFEYDKCNHIVKTTTSDGTTTKFTYDLLGQKTSETDNFGRTNKYEYYPNGSVYKTTFGDGTSVLFTYNQRWKCTTKTYSDGSSEYTTYDLNGNVTSVTDSEGNTVQYEYDLYGRLVKETDANKNVTKYTYDANGNCISKTDALGRTAHMVYDDIDQLTEVYVYDSKGEKYSVTYEYDALGRVIATTDESGYTTRVTYDALGNVKSTIDANGNETDITTYDSVGRVISVKGLDGSVTNYSYDARGNILTAIQNLSGINKSSKYTYDEKGRVVSVKENDAITTKISYDALGNIATITDANGGTTEYKYDDIARLTQVISVLGNKTSYEYNGSGLVSKLTNARGQETKYEYDLLGRVVSMTDELGKVEYTYDANGNLTEVKDSNGTIKRTYDALNRIKSYTDYKGNTIKYAYDELGNLLSITYPGGEVVRYEYYKNGWLKKVIDNNEAVTSYTYNSLGLVLTCTRPNNTKELCTYNNKTGQLLIQREIKTDSNGAFLEEISNYVYKYDASGNISSVEGFENNSEGLTSASFEYDKENRLIKYNGKEVRYDADGNMVYGPVNGVMTDLSYDCRNRLIYAGGVRYEYDAENTRIAEETDEHRIEFITDVESNSLSRVLVKKTYKKTNGVKADNSTDRLYVYGNGLISETEGVSTLYHHYNNIGSTMKLSDGSGNIIAEYTYGPYGELLSGNKKLTDYLYNGQYGVSTDENGLYYMRQRYYNSEIKRFINQDILTGEVGDSQSMNRYAYVEGNPINLMDPFGLSPEMTPWGIMSFIAHGVLGIVGCIPGIPGALANLLDAAIYFAEGDYLNAALSGLCAVTMGTATLFAKAGCIGAKISKGAMVVYQATNLVRNGIDLVNSLSNVEAQFNNIATKWASGEKVTARDYFNAGLAVVGAVASTVSLVGGAGDFVDSIDEFANVKGCFVEGTEVETISGKKDIEDIVEGDYVLAENPETGEQDYKRVLSTYVYEKIVLVHVFVGDEEIVTTEEHPFYVEDEGFVPANKLKEGYILRTSDDEEVSVDQIEIEYLTESVKVYNLRVKGFHTYFVSDKNVLVHNYCSEVDNKTQTTSENNKEGEKASLLPGEGEIGTYRDLVKSGSRGDNITPNHMPSAQYMSQYDVPLQDGLCMNMEMPYPGSGGRHRLTKTYGRNMTDAEKAFYYSLSPRDALAYDIIDARRIYKQDGLYSEMLPQLIAYPKKSKETFPGLFLK